MKKWLCVLSLLLPMAASAAVVERLYDATVPVVDQSVPVRQQAMAAALGEVLIRVTGQRAAPELPAFSDLLAAAPAMVQQFRYEFQERVDEVTGRPQRELQLSVRFDPRAVQRAAIERGVPVWGSERPATLVWIAWDDGQSRGVMDEAAPPEIEAALVRAAMRRGLPLIKPLMDLEDRVAFTFTDVWGGFDEPVVTASERYNPNVILVGRVFRVDRERWAARWTAYDGDEVRYTETAPGVVDAVVADGVHWLADQVAVRAAVMPDLLRDGRTRLIVTEVSALGEYADLLRYLESLSPVAAVALESVDGDRIAFSLDLRGTEDQLQRTIALGDRLQPAAGQVALDGSLHYRLRR